MLNSFIAIPFYRIHRHDIFRKIIFDQQKISKFSFKYLVITDLISHLHINSAARFDAQFPGSINPTVTSNPGPMNLKISSPPNRGLRPLRSSLFKKSNMRIKIRFYFFEKISVQF